MSKYKEDKYQMGESAETTEHHPGYVFGGPHPDSPQTLVRKGIAGMKKRGETPSYIHVEKELLEQANLREKGGKYHEEKVMREGARARAGSELAREKAIAHHEYEHECRTCGKRHKYEERERKRVRP